MFQICVLVCDGMFGSLLASSRRLVAVESFTVAVCFSSVNVSTASCMSARMFLGTLRSSDSSCMNSITSSSLSMLSPA